MAGEQRENERDGWWQEVCEGMEEGTEEDERDGKWQIGVRVDNRRGNERDGS